MVGIRDYRNHFLITTCGISLLANQGSSDERTAINRATSLPEKELSPSQKELIDGLTERARQKIDNAGDSTELKKLSAEINSIITYQEANGFYAGAGKGRQSISHQLLGTDSYAARKSIELLAAWLGKRWGNCQHRLFSISTSNMREFHQGLDDIVTFLADLLPLETRKAMRVVFNLTGGYKSLQGHMQVLGMLWAEEIVYLFETSRDLMSIPRIPVAFDFEKHISDNLDSFRKLDVGLKISEEEKRNIVEGLLIELDDDCMPSFYGTAAWKMARPSLLGKKLLQPLSKRLVYLGDFEKKVNALPSERILALNSKLDRFSRNLENPEELQILAADTFKKIQGTPKAGLTHEMYAWSDSDARRIYGRFNGEVFEIHELGKHL